MRSLRIEMPKTVIGKILATCMTACLATGAAMYFFFPLPMSGWQRDLKHDVAAIAAYQSEHGGLPAPGEIETELELSVTGTDFHLTGWDGENTWWFSSADGKFEKPD